jgi:hypothetical protein
MNKCEEASNVLYLLSTIFAETVIMKRAVLAISISMFVMVAAAQRPYGDFTHVTNMNSGFNSTRDVTDTVVPLSFIPQNEGGLGCFTGVYDAPDSGYVTGNNKYGDLEKAQFFSLAEMGYMPQGSLQSVMVNFGLKTVNSTPEDIFVKIYNVDTAGFQPWQVLGISNPVNISAITEGVPVTFTFPAAVAVGDSFFVSVLLPLISGDTLAVTSSFDDCRSFSNWSWELWSNATWHTLLNSWVLDIDLAIYPVINFSGEVGVGDISAINPVINVFPNPAIDQVNLSVTAMSPGENLLIQLYDAAGRLVHSASERPGHSSLLKQIDLSSFDNGMYLVVASQNGRASTMVFVKQ